MPNIVWEYNNLAINEPIDMGGHAQLEESAEFKIKIRHDSSEEISECGFYLEPFETGEYDGSYSPLKDFEHIFWMANNYPGYGVSLRQEYTVTGQIDGHDGTRIIDYERTEVTDIFAGSQLEILSGEAAGESILIDHYDPENQFIFIDGDFSANVREANYRIAINKEEFFKTGNGADFSSLVPLIYKGGIIERLDSANIFLKVRIPKFARTAGQFLFDLKLQFTSLE